MTTTAAWEAHLDSLEEWVRSCAAAIAATSDDDVVAPEPPRGEPLAPLPTGLALRARLLVAAMDDLVAAGATRRAAEDRAARYRTA